IGRLGHGRSATLGSARLLAQDRRRLACDDARRPAPGRCGNAGLSRQLLRGRRVRALVRQGFADRRRMGSRRQKRCAQRRLRHRLAVDPRRLHPISRLQGAIRRDRRIQRQVHGQPDGTARLVAGDAGRAFARELSQLFLSVGTLAIQRTAPGGIRTLSKIMVRAVQAARRAAPVSPNYPFAADVLAGLAAKPKSLPPKYFYDLAGSALFDPITGLPEYYPTRSEIGILQANAPAIASLFPQNCALIEFGGGSSRKARMLLGAAAPVEAYLPVDISGDFWQQDAAQLRRDFPHRGVYPLVEDFTKPFTLPPAIAELPRVGFFPGSTIGNFEPHEACKFLRHAGGMLGKGALFVIGVDLVKDTKILYDAYNDAEGVTAKFNLNLLARINRELGADFNLGAFEHHAFYNSAYNRIEMHLASTRRQKVRLNGAAIDFRAGETIH